MELAVPWTTFFLVRGQTKQTIQETIYSCKARKAIKDTPQRYLIPFLAFLIFSSFLALPPFTAHCARRPERHDLSNTTCATRLELVDKSRRQVLSMDSQLTGLAWGQV